MDAGITRPRFVGRTEELERLGSAFARARDGRPGVVLVAGEAGIGKSRLVDEALAACRGAGEIVLTGSCLPPGPGGPPYLPVVAILGSLRRAVEPGALAAVLGPGRGMLGRLVPDLLDRAGDLGPDVPDATSQVRLFELVAGAVERLARRAPVVVSVEDLQWADPSSRALLDFLVRGIRTGERLVVVATLRTDALDEADPVRGWIAELQRLPVVERLDLAALPRPEVASILADILRRPPDPAFVDRVMERANGNAFLVEELGAMGDSPDAPLPEHLREILVTRLGAVDPATRDVLRAAAAGGGRVDDGLLAEVLGADPGTVDTALREAVRRGILTTDPATGELRFRHLLLLDAVEDELFPAERRRLHLAYAAALEREASEGARRRPEELAFHWDAAGRPERAAPAHVEAGRAAARVYAWTEAARAFDRALELERQTPGILAAADLDEVLLDAAGAWGMLGAYDRAVTLTRRAVELIDPERDPVRAAHAHERLRWSLWQAGDLTAAAHEVEASLRLAPPSPPSVVRARALAHAAGLALWTADPSTALRLADEGIEMARQVEDPSQEALGLGVAGLALALLGDVDGGAERVRGAMAIGRRLEAAEGLALGYANLTAIYDRAGRTSEALAAAEEGFAEVERFGLARTFGVPLLAEAARMRFHEGRWGDAESLLARARALMPLPAARATVELQAARLAAARGRFEEAEAALERATSDGLEAVVAAGASPGVVPGPGGGRGQLLQARIELAAWREDLPAARAVEDEALAAPLASPAPDASLAWVGATALRAEADAAVEASLRHDEVGRSRALHRAAAIGRWLEEGLGALGGDLDRAAAADPRVGAVARLCLAEGGRAEGRSDPAAWAAVAASWEAQGRPLPTAYARYREGEASLLSPDGRDGAREALRSAAHAAAELGAAPLLGSVERLARLARIDLAAAEARAPRSFGTGEHGATAAAGAEAALPAALGLTPREQEVLRLVAAGWSNPEIGDELGISPRTASVHVSNVLAKLGVPNRVEAAMAAMRLGLVAGSPGRADAGRRAEADSPPGAGGAVGRIGADAGAGSNRLA